jgi:glycine/sarcosine/betaine reductase complex component A
MDLHTQEAIIKLVDQHGKDELLVVLGAPDPESAEIAAETVVLGDPSYAGPLAGTQLGLDVYHVLEDEVRGEVPDDVWENEIGVMSDVLDADGIAAAVSAMRAKAGDASS